MRMKKPILHAMPGLEDTSFAIRRNPASTMSVPINRFSKTVRLI
jgi:hypothetical protein